MSTELDHTLGVRVQFSSDASALNLMEFWEQRMAIEIEEQRELALKKSGFMRKQAHNDDHAIFELEVA
jgi:hypothetical protein